MSSARTETITTSCGSHTHFLAEKSTYSSKLYPGAKLGHNAIEHRVFVINDGKDPINKNDGDVVLSISDGMFGLQEYLTPTEARALAKALTMGADRVYERAEESLAADFLRSQAATDRCNEVPA